MLHPTCMHTGVLLLTGRGTPLQQKPGICRLFHWLLHLSTTPTVFLRICTGGETYIQLYHQCFKMNKILNELTLNLNGCSLFFYELSLQKLSVLTVITVTELHFSCHCEVVKTFRLWRGLYSLSIAFCTWCWWAHSPIYIYFSPPTDFCTHLLAARCAMSILFAHFEMKTTACCLLLLMWAMTFCLKPNHGYVSAVMLFMWFLP